MPSPNHPLTRPTARMTKDAMKDIRKTLRKVLGSFRNRNSRNAARPVTPMALPPQIRTKLQIMSGFVPFRDTFRCQSSSSMVSRLQEPSAQRTAAVRKVKRKSSTKVTISFHFFTGFTFFTSFTSFSSVLVSASAGFISFSSVLMLAFDLFDSCITGSVPPSVRILQGFPRPANLLPGSRDRSSPSRAPPIR